jgi:hypothetical protein
MSFKEILEQLPKLIDDEKRQLWNILDQELAGEGEEGPEFLAALDCTCWRFGSWCGLIHLMRPAK